MNRLAIEVLRRVDFLVQRQYRPTPAEPSARTGDRTHAPSQFRDISWEARIE
jgi:hypothetical protein